jgi:hypothetical protein
MKHRYDFDTDLLLRVEECFEHIVMAPGRIDKQHRVSRLKLNEFPEQKSNRDVTEAQEEFEGSIHPMNERASQGLKNFSGKLNCLYQLCDRPTWFFLGKLIESLANPNPNTNKDVWASADLMTQFAKSVTDPNDRNHIAFWMLHRESLVGDISSYTLNTAVATPKVRLGTIDEYSCPREVPGGLDSLWLRAIWFVHSG